ncbi:hypothetical protein STENM223S_06130 [Streptomyces tendae]
MSDGAGSVMSGGRRGGMEVMTAGRSDGAPGTTVAHVSVTERGVGSRGKEAPEVPGWASRQTDQPPADGTGRHASGPLTGPALAGGPATAVGRPHGQERAHVRAPGAAPRGGPGATSGMPTAPGMLDGVRRRLAESGAEPTPARVAQALREQGRVLGDAEILGAAEQLRSELVGSGPLEPLLADPSVTDVLVSAPDRVWVDRGGGLELAPVAFPDAGAVRRLAQRLATVAGRRLDDARPWVDARLPDGTRLHAVLPPVAVGCTCLSLRVVRPRAFTLDELAAAGTVPPGGDRVLRALMRARLSFLVSGGTGSGKTTAAQRPARARRAGRTPRAGGGLGGAAARPPARRPPGDPTGEPGGRGPGHPGGPGAPGTAHAAGPAGRGRGARSRGGPSPGRVEHGARGRVRNACTPTPPLMSRPGWRHSARPRASTAPPCTVNSRRPSRWCSTWSVTAPGDAGSPRCTCWNGIPPGLVRTVPALRWGAGDLRRRARLASGCGELLCGAGPRRRTVGREARR